MSNVIDVREMVPISELNLMNIWICSESGILAFRPVILITNAIVNNVRVPRQHFI